MKILLDENIPKEIKQEFQEFDIYTISDMKWTGIKNGELLKYLFQVF